MDKIKIIVLSLVMTTFALLVNADTKKVEEEQFITLEALSSPLYIAPMAYLSLEDYEKPYQSSASIEAMADKIIECESNGRMIYGDNGMAYGIAQFWKATFSMMSKQSGMTWLDYYSEDDQRTLLLWALENNLGFHWTCWRSINGYN
jgi:hypothetical protein